MRGEMLKKNIMMFTIVFWGKYFYHSVR